MAKPRLKDVLQDQPPSHSAPTGGDARPGPSLGRRLRALRRERGWTLMDVSRLTGISVSTLSKLENGRTSLNFSSVLKLSNGLSLPAALFIGADGPSSSPRRRAVTRAGEAIINSTRTMVFEVLCSDFSPKHNIFWRVTVKARSLDDFGPLLSHPGEEFIHVIEGVLDLHTESGPPLRLAAGDSVHFDALTAHGYVAAGERDVILLMSNTVADGPVSGFNADRRG